MINITSDYFCFYKNKTSKSEGMSNNILKDKDYHHTKNLLSKVSFVKSHLLLPKVSATEEIEHSTCSLLLGTSSQAAFTYTYC